MTMTDTQASLVERLRAAIELHQGGCRCWQYPPLNQCPWFRLLREAADQIEADAERIKELEADLEKAELSAYACPNCYQRADRCTCDVKLV